MNCFMSIMIKGVVSQNILKCHKLCGKIFSVLKNENEINNRLRNSFYLGDIKL